MLRRAFLGFSCSSLLHLCYRETLIIEEVNSYMVLTTTYATNTFPNYNKPVRVRLLSCRYASLKPPYIPSLCEWCKLQGIGILFCARCMSVALDL